MIIRLREYQRTWNDAIARDRSAGFTRLLVDAPGGVGKCFGRGTPILLFDGTEKRVEDIMVGDVLIGPDSSPRIVESTHAGRDEMYRVSPKKGSSYVVNGEHVLSLKSSSGSDGLMVSGRLYAHGETINISVSDFIKERKAFHHSVVGWRAAVDSWTSKLHPDMPPYIMGFWLGDGTCGVPAFTAGDIEPIAEIKRWASTIEANAIEANKRNGCCTVRVRSNVRGWFKNRMAASLTQLGVYFKKSIPHCYKTASVKDRLELLAGLMDSDGSRTSCGYDFISISESMANDVAFVARSLGFAAYVRPCEKKCQNGNGGIYHRVGISGNCSIVPCRIPRKKCPPRRQVKNVLHVGINVDYIGRGEYFGFSVSGPDKLFLLGDFTVAHNSTVFAFLAYKEWTERQGRTLVLENRDKLVRQTAERIRNETGLECDIEMAGQKADPFAPIVVASVATLGRINRLTSFQDDHFSLIVPDEAHHVLAPLFARVMDYFHYGADSLADDWVEPKDGTYTPKAHIVGFTATPDIGTSKNLGILFQKMSVSYSYLNAIEDGWLVGLREENIPVKIDTRKFRVKRTGQGMDFSPEDESRALVPVIEELAEQIFRLAAGKKTMAFLPSLECARMMSEALNRRGLKALYVSGVCLDKDEKTDAFNAHGPGIVLCLCALYVEGADFPSVDCVAWMRATISKAFYKQGIYRVTRTLPGLVSDDMTAEQRRSAIAASAKPHGLVISPFFISDRIDICEVFDLYADRPEGAPAPKMRGDMADPKKIRDYIESLRKAADKHAHKQPRTINPVSFALSLGDKALAAYQPETPADSAPPSRELLDFLLSKGCDTTLVRNQGQAQKMVDRLRERERLGLAEPKQLNFLRSLTRYDAHHGKVVPMFAEETLALMKKNQAGAIIGKRLAAFR